MTTIDLGGIKARWSRNHVVITPSGPQDVSWVLAVGIATPSIKYFPMAWNVIAVEKQPGRRFTVDVFRTKVSDD